MSTAADDPRPPAGAGPSGDPSAPRPLRSWLLLGIVVVALLAIWRLTPLAKLLDRAYLGELARAIAATPAAPALALAAYVVLLLVLFPITPLVAVTGLVFDPGRAYVISLTGALSGAALGWVIGRLVARHRPRWIEARRFQPLRARLRHRGILTMALTRLLPAGNFTLMNVIAGAIGIRFRDFILGSAIGVQPGLLALTLLAHEVRHLGWLP
jgi:uncharacterized membrane protein YdjX (TVP38/TMEM64 family)